MKKFLSFYIVIIALLPGSGCKKDNAPQESEHCNNLPHNTAPAELQGNWANGYSSYTDIVDAYNGQVIGNAWQSGKLFKITSNGTNAAFYYMAQSQYSKSATKATGTIHFDEGSTGSEGSFTFNACWAHFKGWGSTSVDRDATQAELSNQLTRRYYYLTDGNWLRIQPDEPVNEYSSSFEIVD